VFTEDLFFKFSERESILNPEKHWKEMNELAWGVFDGKNGNNFFKTFQKIPLEEFLLD